MCESPDSLQNTCVQFISRHLNSVYCTVEDLNGNIEKYVCKYDSLCLPTNVTEHLFAALDEKFLTDQLLTIFDPTVTRLKQVFIHDASKLSSKGLRNLRSHKLTELSVIKLVNVTYNDLIGCMGDWTLQNLRLLNVSQSTFLNSDKVRVVIALSKLRNLQCLDVSFTMFNSQGLEIVVEDLPRLESLNISGTMVSDISPLKKCKNRLKFLTMYNLRIWSHSDFMLVLSELSKLQHLDISVDKNDPLELSSSSDIDCTNVFDALKNLPELTSLDLSGKQGLEVDRLKLFLQNHRRMQFLGLMECQICQDDAFCRVSDSMFNKNLTVTGFATQEQILHSLRRYMYRKPYLQKSLCYLYNDIQDTTDVRLDIIKLVVQSMRSYPDVMPIQMAATACIYNLTKGGFSLKIHVHWLKKIVDCTLKCMENFPKQQQLQKNSLLTLCSDRMLQDVSFDRYHCAELVMNSLMAFDDPAMNRMSVAICSILAAKISTVETSNLGAKKHYMIRLLEIVKSKAEEREIDIMMKFTLSALWNLTDESPKTCGVFLDLGGMKLFLEVLHKFSGESSIETKVLGLMNNIAEVRTLRKHLLQDEFVRALRLLLHSEHIDVSYFAAGIVAHIASEGEYFWNCTSVNWSEMIEELGSAVLSWEVPATEMVAYRSFNPFYALFFCFTSFQVQLWAAWAVHHVCLKNPKRYCKMIFEEGGVEILKSLAEHYLLHRSVAHFVYEILEFVKEEFPSISTPERKESFV